MTTHSLFSNFYTGFSFYFSKLFFKTLKTVFFLNKPRENVKLSKNYFFFVFFTYERIFEHFEFLTILDSFFIFLLFFFENSKNYLFSASRVKFRLKQSNLGLYINLNNENSKLFNNATYFLYGLKSLWHGLRFWFLSLVIGLTAFYALMAFRFVPLLKISFQWLCIVMFLYWLMSGFVFFIKKYQTSKFTTVIQRFWRRSYILFWLIETSVFVTFLYVTFNASQEPFYMHDQIKVFKTHLFSWRYLLLKVIAVAVLIVLSYCLLLFLKWNIYTKQSVLFFL